MLGDYVLTANDIMQGKIFEDTVAYGGWPLDDHNPDGFDGTFSNYSIPVKSPYGIPYRCLYSKNVKNLFFAGRNISATHMATSSARVMGTCSIIGQAVGVAAWVANKHKTSPRGVLAHVGEVQRVLMQNDCFLPKINREVASVCKKAKLLGASDVLRNGKDRDFACENENICNNGEFIQNGKPIKYVFEKPARISAIKIVFDSDLTRATYDVNECEKQHSMRCNILDDSPVMHMPKTLAKAYELEILFENGKNATVKENQNKKRNVLVPAKGKVKQITLTVFGNYGETDKTKLFTFECY